MKNKISRLCGIDFIRIICAFGIVCFHFAAYSACGLKILAGNANGNWGEAFVALFFVVSGFVIYLNNSGLTDVKTFYLKRARALYPSFWIAYAVVFIIRVIRSGKLFYLDGIAERWTLLLSFIGMDGYTLYKIPNYYILGEWFLGAILLLYLFYPLIVKLFSKTGPAMTAVLFVLFIILTYTDPFEMALMRNPVSCLMAFTTGMTACRYRDRILENKAAVIISAVVAAAFAFIKLPVNEATGKMLLGISLFLPLYYAGEKLAEIHVFSKLISEGARISYEIFLLHHVLIRLILTYINPVSKKLMLLVLAGTFIVIVLAAELLKLARVTVHWRRSE